MRILNREKFLSLPKGVVYSFYESMGDLKGLYEKGETSEMKNDWYATDLLKEVDVDDSEGFFKLFEKAEEGQVFRLDYGTEMRDAMYRNDQMFAVYDDDDVLGLIVLLQKLRNAYPKIDWENI